MAQGQRRRLLIAAVALPAVQWIFVAQPYAQRTFKIGVLFAGTLASSDGYFRAFFESLASLGYIEGKNLHVERRFAEGRIDRLDALAAELVAAKLDVIYAPPTPAVLAARRASSTIPIVFSMSPDPVGARLVKSLRKPGGNTTGLSTLGEEIVSKRIELIREIAPHARRIGLLYDSREPATRSTVATALRVANSIGLTPIEADARTRDQLSAAFAVFKDKGAQAVLAFEGSLALITRDLIVSLAAVNRLPALYPYSELPAAGGLMSYSVDMAEQFRRAAFFVDRILKGTAPSDLPIEQPIKLQLVINRRTAQALGLDIPSSILLRADRLIE